MIVSRPSAAAAANIGISKIVDRSNVGIFPVVEFAFGVDNSCQRRILLKVSLRHLIDAHVVVLRQAHPRTCRFKAANASTLAGRGPHRPDDPGGVDAAHHVVARLVDVVRHAQRNLRGIGEKADGGSAGRSRIG